MDVEIWSDIACPWCYVGKRRFETALAQFEHRDEVRVTWRSFELDPSAPREREGDRAARLAEKYGMTLEQARAAEHQLGGVAAGEGLDFHFDIARSGRTFDGHRMIHLAAEHDLQDAMKERLLRAYFTEGELIGDHDTLVRLAAEVGLPEDEVRRHWPATGSPTRSGPRSWPRSVRDQRRAHVRRGPVAGRLRRAPARAAAGLLRQGWANRPR